MVVFFEVCWFTIRFASCDILVKNDQWGFFTTLIVQSNRALCLYASHISGTKKMKNLWYNRVQGLHCLYLKSFVFSRSLEVRVLQPIKPDKHF